MGKMPKVNAAHKNAKAASPVREHGGIPYRKTKQPSIKQQLAAGRNQLNAEHAAAPARAAVKSKNNAWEV